MLLPQPGLGLSAQARAGVPSLIDVVIAAAPTLLGWAWLLVAFFGLWLMWSLYRYMISITVYLWTVKWTVLQVRLPDDAEQTPKAMENAVALWGGIFKAPDVFEKYFDGRVEWWYSLEVQCTSERVRYFLFVPDVFRDFFEGVIYGQYPEAEIQEVEDYTLNYDYKKVRKEFELFGTDVILAQSDVYPIRTYTEYEDPLAPEEGFIDPHQAIVEAFSNVNPGEEFWFQVIVWPTEKEHIEHWIHKGEEEIARITGREHEAGLGLLGQLKDFFVKIPMQLVNALRGPEALEESHEEESQIRFFDPVETTKMEGILRKISREVYPSMVRLIYIAPKGKLHKPNIGRAFGVFKQFSTFHLNAFKPDPKTKSNGVDYIMKERRRRFRERAILAEYQWRDPLGLGGGPFMLTAEEIATLYHFPTRWIQAPVLERAKAGKFSAPENVPYI